LSVHSSKKIAIAVAVTFAPEAFDSQGNYANSGDTLFPIDRAYMAPAMRLQFAFGENVANAGISQGVALSWRIRPFIVIVAAVEKRSKRFGGHEPVPATLIGVWIPKDTTSFILSLRRSEKKVPVHSADHFRIGSNTKTFVISVLLQW